MDTNEILTNEDVIKTTDEIAETANSSKAFNIVAGVGLAVLVGVVAYKYAIKPLAAKIKAKKEQKEIEKDFEDSDYEDEESEEN